MASMHWLMNTVKVDKQSVTDFSDNALLSEEGSSP